jgi:hypothetical protein
VRAGRSADFWPDELVHSLIRLGAATENFPPNPQLNSAARWTIAQDGCAESHNHATSAIPPAYR